MVMTQSRRPGVSVAGIMLASVLAVGSWAVVPAQSCPPKEKAPACEKVQVDKVSAPLLVQRVGVAGDKAGCKLCGKKCDAKCKEACEKACQHKDGQKVHEVIIREHGGGLAGTYQKHLAGRGSAQPLLVGDAPPTVVYLTGDHEGDGPAMEERLARLEAQLQKMAHELQAMSTELRGSAAPRRAAVPRGQNFFRPGQPPAPPTPPEPVRRARGSRSIAPKSETITRSYKLPKHKLEALTKLMVRQDVPVLVSPQTDSIELHGTEAQHVVFGRFLSLLNKEEEQQVKYQLPEGKLEALTELMVIKDVPTLVRPGKDNILVYGSSIEQAAFRDFVNMINTGEAPRAIGAAGAKARQQFEEALAMQAWAGEGERKELVEALVQAEALKGRRWAQAGVERQVATAPLKLQVEMLEAQARQLEKQAEEMERKADKLEREAQKIEQEAERREQKAEDLEEQIDRMRDKSSEGEPREREKVHARLASLMEKYESLQNDFASYEGQFDELEHEADRLRDKADEVRDRADSYREALDIMRDLAKSADT